jgi:hypothetical protein
MRRRMLTTTTIAERYGFVIGSLYNLISRDRNFPPALEWRTNGTTTLRDEGDVRDYFGSRMARRKRRRKTI